MGNTKETKPKSQNGQLNTLDKLFSIKVDDEEDSIIRHLFSFDGDSLKTKTEISPRLIIPLSRALVIGELMKSTILLKFCKELMLLNISKERKGRGEIMAALAIKGNLSEDEE